MNNQYSVAQWTKWGSANVSDALRALGKSFQTVGSGINPLAPNMAVAGPAFTVRCYPGATWAMEKALEQARAGDVLVVDGGASPDVILMGGLMSTRAQARGIAGAILDAAVRDVEEIVRLGFPVFSRHICARAGTFAEIGELQTTICCGRTPVHSGDWIVADRSGIVVVPQEMADDAAREAERINARESAIAERLMLGESFEEALKHINQSADSR
jgi:4-hydroxy-4-methyl-2-oxoglutarate aldolase